MNSLERELKILEFCDELRIKLDKLKPLPTKVMPFWNNISNVKTAKKFIRKHPDLPNLINTLNDLYNELDYYLSHCNYRDEDEYRYMSDDTIEDFKQQDLMDFMNKIEKEVEDFYNQKILPTIYYLKDKYKRNVYLYYYLKILGSPETKIENITDNY
jgi:hypothetical protein